MGYKLDLYTMDQYRAYKTDAKPIRIWLDQSEIRYSLLALHRANKITWCKSVIGPHDWEVFSGISDEATYDQERNNLLTSFGNQNAAQETQLELLNMQQGN